MEERIGQDNEDAEKKFLSSPGIVENYNLLRDLGVFTFIDSLSYEIHNYRTLLTRGLDIFNRTSIDDIMDATVWQISDHFLPSFIAFLWKPIQNRADITIKAYKNYKPAELDLQVENITAFETFFHQFPRPINFETLASELKNDEAIKPFVVVNPELVVPILGPFGLYGIILVGRKILQDEYSKDELFFLQLLMSFVSQAIKNHLHYEHSLRDVKTGLYNHGFFMTRLKEELARAKRIGYASSIIVMDVDKFKDFNDSYGHLAGDQVLEKLALVIKQNVRTDDIPSRFGGEEFTVLLPHTDILTAWTVAERLRISVSLMQVPWEVPLPQVTLSVGIYSFDQYSEVDCSDIIRRGDDALYISKARGRNRSTIWEVGLTGKDVDSKRG
jgi:diguanylate cyclase (GGDEF)-like protein